MAIKFLKNSSGGSPQALKPPPAVKVHPSVKWVYSLGPEKAAVVDGLLMRGEAHTRIAKRIQEEWGLYPELERKTLEMRLYRYHKRITEPRMVANQSKLPAAKIERTIDRLNTKVDFLQGMADLIELQAKRVTAGAKKEDDDKRFMRDFHKDITALGNLYVQFAEMNMDLGIIPRINPKMPGVSVNVNTFASEGQFAQQVKVTDNVHQATLEALRILAPQQRRVTKQTAIEIPDEAARPE